MIEQISEDLFAIPVPGREKPVVVAFAAEGNAGILRVFGSQKEFMGEWDLTEEGATVFRTLGTPGLLGVMSELYDQLVGLVAPLAEKVDQREREAMSCTDPN